MLLLHYTATSSIEDAVRIFQKPAAESSSHYIIGKDGKVIQMVRDAEQAFHAGPSHWMGKKSCNRFSIGIELVNEGTKQKVIPYTKEQYTSLITLCRKLIRKYAIPPERILGHSDVATPTGRKRDPGPHFDWEFLANNGIGRVPNHPKYNLPPRSSKLQVVVAVGSGSKLIKSKQINKWKTLQFGLKGKEVERLQKELKRIGYNIKVNGSFGNETRKVVKTFQIHYRRYQVTGIVDLDTHLRIKQISRSKHRIEDHRC